MKIDDIRLSFSALKAFGKSPAHFVYYKKRKFKQSAPMRRGWLAHLLTLEPEKQLEILVIDVQTRANKQFKEAVAEHGENSVFTRKEYNEALNLAEAVMAHPLANKLISEATAVEKHIEFSLDGVKFHGYADVIGKDYIADLKITDNEPRKIQRWVLDNLYNMQLALYAHSEFNSEAHIKHYLITCDPNAPYGVIVYEMSAEMALDGFNRARVEVGLFKDWYRSWDGETMPKSYDFLEPLDTPMLLELPNWYK
tara:strand:- start:2219 stop:2977 length:759 start_codon:yes stop_codon:yes gene_type:complete